MKKFLLIAAMAVASLAASATDWYTGGQVTFGRTTESVSGKKTTQVTILPELGYNLTDHVAVGTTLGLTYKDSDGHEMTTFGLSPYIRYNYLKTERVDLFIDGGVDLAMGRANGSFALTYGIGLRPGIVYHLNDKFSLVAHVGFLGYQSGNKPARHNGAPENWGLDLNTNNLMFGFSYNF